MRKVMKLSLAAAVSALALGAAALHAAKAADMYMPQGQVQAPPEPYGPPPVAQGYPPPPPVYGYPPPPVGYYPYAPRVAVWPRPYYGRGPYWGGYYGPRYAYGYGRWGYRRW
jgi:hypothetical protein